MIQTIQDYIDWYTDHYGNKPTSKLIESFCKINNIQQGEKKEEEPKVFAPVMCEMAFGWELEG